MKVRMLCNYILPERDEIVSLVFQTEPSSYKWTKKRNLFSG